MGGEHATGTIRAHSTFHTAVGAFGSKGAGFVGMKRCVHL